MKAARFHGRGDVRLEDVPEPRPGPGQVQIDRRERLGAVLEQGLRLVAEQRFDVGGVGLDGHGVPL